MTTLTEFHQSLMANLMGGRGQLAMAPSTLTNFTGYTKYDMRYVQCIANSANSIRIIINKLLGHCLILSNFWYYVSNHILPNCYSFAVLFYVLCSFVTYSLLNTE